MVFDANGRIQLCDDQTLERVQLEMGNVYADTPARCFLLGTKYHSGYYGCGRCETHGSFKKNRTCFPEVSAPRRSDASFALKLQVEHHKNDSILVSALGIKAISQVPLDAMHLVYLGITKKIIHGLMNPGKFQIPARSVTLINNRLMQARETQPSEFCRRIRKMSEFGLFKATEYRVFLLYTGMVALKDIVPPATYDMFMLLCCGIRILSDDKQFQINNTCAKNLLNDFLVDFGELGGQYLMSYNIHNAQHLADETLLQNLPLDRFATWEFESSNAQLKLYSRKPSDFLQQAYNRTIEKYNCYHNTSSRDEDNNIIKSKPLNNSDEICGRKPKKFVTILNWNNLRIDSRDRNKWFFTVDGDIWEFHSAYEKKETNGDISTIIRGRRTLKNKSFFKSPINSSLLNIFSSDKKLDKPNEINIQKIKFKMFSIELENNTVFIPMI